MDILITLGHNSSVICVDQHGYVIYGAEEERFTRNKSESRFPISALNAAIEYAKKQNVYSVGKIFMSHWFDDFNFHLFSENKHTPHYGKYYDFDKMYELEREGFDIISLNKNFTHHDAHAYSVVSFFEKNASIQQKLQIDQGEGSYIFVCDGFGNQQEVFSIYKIRAISGLIVSIERVKTIKGYEKSLGLMYQYATSYLGMKENQDEYKLLGYEAYYKEIFQDNEEEENFLNSMIDESASALFNNINAPASHNSDPLYINKNALAATKNNWFNVFDYVLNSIKVSDITNKRDSEFIRRVIIARFVQQVLERFHDKLIDDLERKSPVKNILVAGGVYYNVKLNNHILKRVKRSYKVNDNAAIRHEGVFCAIPLAGDQGCSIGLYRHFYTNNVIKSFKWNDNLAWGVRELDRSIVEKQAEKLPNVHFFEKHETVEGANFIAEKIVAGDIVNLVCSRMEFGPRALCNTSTLFLPTKENAQTNNLINERNEVMPTCPVLQAYHFDKFFNREDFFNHVAGSLKYMILAIDYKIDFSDEFAGIMHNYPELNGYTGRPQVVEDTFISMISRVLNVLSKEKVYAITNTSFNYHGVPIVNTVQDAVNDFSNNIENVKKFGINKNVHLVFYEGV